MRIDELIASGQSARAFIDEAFPNLTDLAALARKQVETKKPWSAFDGTAPTVIGTAFDYRLRFWFAITPFNELTARAGANRVLREVLGLTQVISIDQFKTGGPPGERIGADSLLHSTWVADPHGEFTGVPNFISSLAESVDTRIGALNPVGRQLAGPDEQELARLCLLLGLLEQVYRSGKVSPGSPLSGTSLRTTLDEILDSMPDLWVEDLAGLMARAHSSWPSLSVAPAILNPHFKPGVDGDLIVAGILYEIKTGLSLEFPAWIRQLLAYALLDFTDEYGIAGIGFYLARHGLLMRWSMDEVVRVTGGGATPSLAELRMGFRSCIEKTVGPIDGPRPAIAYRNRREPLGPGSNPWEKDIVSVGEASELTGRAEATIRRSVTEGVLIPVSAPTGKRPANYGNGVMLNRKDVLAAFPPKQIHVCDSECDGGSHVAYFEAQLPPDQYDVEFFLRALHGIGTLTMTSLSRSVASVAEMPRLTRYRELSILGDAAKAPWLVFRCTWAGDI